MRKTFLIALISIFAVSVSCSKDNDIIPDDTSGNINGVWTLKAEYNSGIRQPLSDCRLHENLAFEGNSITMIKTDETGNTGCSLNTAEGTFSRADNTLSIKFPDENQKFKIKELTTVKLVLVTDNAATILEYERAQ